MLVRHFKNGVRARLHDGRRFAGDCLENSVFILSILDDDLGLELECTSYPQPPSLWKERPFTYFVEQDNYSLGNQACFQEHPPTAHPHDPIAP